MPKVFEWRGYRFYSYAHEGTPLEPAHIHVRKDGKEAKFWLRPFVSLAYNRGFNGVELKRIAQHVILQRDVIESKWNGFFNLK